MSRGIEAEGRGDRAAMVEQICEGLREGIPLAITCRRIGIHPNTCKDWRRKDVDISNAIDAAFEYGIDMIAHRSRKTIRGEKPYVDSEGNPVPDAGESTGNLERDKAIVWHDVRMLQMWDSRYARRLQLANDPKNPLTDAKPPAQLTDEQLMAIANGAAKDSAAHG